MYQVVLTEKVVKSLQTIPKADEEYLDELWAEKAVADFNKSKPGKLFSLDEVKEKLGHKKQQSNTKKRSKPDSKAPLKEKKVKA